MLLVNNTQGVSRALGDKAAVRITKEAGFDALDYSGIMHMTKEDNVLCTEEYRAYAKDLRQYADSLEIPFVQAHALAPAYSYRDKAYSERMFANLIRSFEICSILGVPALIIHPLRYFDVDEDLKTANMAFYRKLLPYAKEFDVKICLENMWGWDQKRGRIVPDVCSWAKDFADYIDSLDSPYFTACLDLGHCGVIGEDADKAIRILGHDRLTALHVHDNDHIHDTHTLPYYGKMDWDAICQALHDIRYRGNFTYEAQNFLNPLPADEAVLSAASAMMATVGRYLIDKIDL